MPSVSFTDSCLTTLPGSEPDVSNRYALTAETGITSSSAVAELHSLLRRERPKLHQVAQLLDEVVAVCCEQKIGILAQQPGERTSEGPLRCRVQMRLRLFDDEQCH